MTQEIFYFVLFGWSLCLTIGYRWGFKTGRLQGQWDVVNCVAAYKKRLSDVTVEEVKQFVEEEVH